MPQADKSERSKQGTPPYKRAIPDIIGSCCQKVRKWTDVGAKQELFSSVYSISEVFIR
jgi:hypothetical protein